MWWIFSNPKSLIFWTGESSALAIPMKAEGEPLPRKITYKFFFHRTPTCVVIHLIDLFFSFLPPSQETCEGKVPQLYSGFGYEQIVKMAWTSLILHLETLARAAQILHARTSCEKGTAESSPKSLKKSPSNSSKKKTDFGLWDPDTCNLIGCGRGTPSNSFHWHFFSLVNPLDVGLVNLNLRGFCSDEVYAEFVIHSSGVYCWSSCPQLRVYAGVLLLTAQLTKVDFNYHVMENFPKSLVFWKGESSALAILLKAEGEPLPRKITYKFFFHRTPARAVRSKAEE